MNSIIFLLILLGLAYSEVEDCECGNSHTFNQTSYKCVKNPKKETDGGVNGCSKY